MGKFSYILSHQVEGMLVSADSVHVVQVKKQELI